MHSIHGQAFIFIENYLGGGAVSHMSEYITALANEPIELKVISNREVLNIIGEQLQIHPRNLLKIDFVSSPRIDYLVSCIIRNRLTLRVTSWLFRSIDPIFYCVNLLLFIAILFYQKPHWVASFNGGYPASQASIAFVHAASLLRITHFMSVVSMPTLKKNLLLAPWEYILDYIVNHSISNIIANAAIINESLSTDRGITLPNKITIYNGISDVYMDYPKDHTINLGVISRQDHLKGGIDLIKAFNLIATDYANLHLYIGGTGTAQHDLEAEREKSSAKDRIHLLGEVSNLKKQLLAKIDIYVFPSHWEGFPISILEAMSAGCAIVSTNVGGIQEVIKHKHNGILVPPRSPHKLSVGIRLYLDNTELFHKCATNARIDFLRSYQKERMHKCISKILSSLD